MKQIEQLQRVCFLIRFGDANWKDCVEWAIDRLRNDEEGDDLDVVMLAAATHEDEVIPLVHQIIERYIGPGAISDQMAAGKLIVDLHAAFKGGKETVISLEPKLWRLYYDLGMPDWLVMLARNCEYATDIDAFRQPFEQEFEYISGLWSKAKSLDDFFVNYDHNVSKSHDAV